MYNILVDGLVGADHRSTVVSSGGSGGWPRNMAKFAKLLMPGRPDRSEPLAARAMSTSAPRARNVRRRVGSHGWLGRKAVREPGVSLSNPGRSSSIDWRRSHCLNISVSGRFAPCILSRTVARMSLPFSSRLIVVSFG